MKTLHLSIIVIVFGVLIIPSVQNIKAIPYTSPQDLYKQSYMVFYGQVISKQTGPGPDYYYYQIRVETYFKNPQTSESITVAGHIADNKTRMSYPQFEVGDKAIFYIIKLDGINTISSYSTKAGEACDLHAFLGSSPIPGEPLIRGWPAEYPFFLRDENGNGVSRITTGHQVVLTYELWNNHPEWKSFALEVLLQRDIDTQPVFYKKQNVEMQPCSNLNVVQSSNTLTEGGNYTAKAILDGKVMSEIGFEVKDSIKVDTNSTIHVIIPNNGADKSCTEKNNCYVPENVTIQEIGRVVWFNNDTLPHTVTSGTPDKAGEFFDSQIILQGRTFEHTFTDSGTYPYFDQIHPWMTGTVIVGNGTFSKTKHLEHIPRTVPPPLRQFEDGTDPYKVKCEGNLVLIVSINGLPACVKEATAVKLWDQGWASNSTGIYTKYATPQILKQFQSKIISKENAIQLVHDYIKENNLTLNVNTTDSRFRIVTSLNYELISKGYNYLLDVDPKTGLPSGIMSPWWTDYYRNPQWWAELEKYYLGMENNRIEDGALVWHVDYRDCLNCIAPYPMFMVDAITGKIVLASDGYNRY